MLPVNYVNREQVAYLFNSSSEAPAGHVLVYIASDDIEADLKKVEELSGKVIHPKSEIPHMGYAFFQDPTGNVLGLYTSMNPRSN